jgi:membrane-associated phospholipid phosphatase
MNFASTPTTSAEGPRIPRWALLALLPPIARVAWAIGHGGARWEDLAVLGIVAGLVAGGRRARRVLAGAYPFGLVVMLYESLRRAGGSSAIEAVHVCDLRARELAIFGANLSGRRVTWGEWLQAHPSSVLDALCAVPYATFLLACCACAAWLFVRDGQRMIRFGWSFFALSLAGFATYRIYPAAPPWYYHAHGCLVDAAARASEGPALARVDARVGVHYFAAMYGRSTSVFGAMPSLHVGYTLLAVLAGWPTWRLAWRIAGAAYVAWMIFAAVYLDHHWVLDTLAGATYAALVAIAAWAIAVRRPWRSS